jgi:ABC-type glycerol-3-phosphate transport system substrate-binding protein
LEDFVPRPLQAVCRARLDQNVPGWPPPDEVLAEAWTWDGFLEPRQNLFHLFRFDRDVFNKWLISGQGALIMNPPGAWAVAVRDAPGVAEQLWTFHSPKGPKGRFDPCNFGFWGIWNFFPNSAAAKSLLAHLSTRSSVEKLVAGSRGGDIPPFEKLRDFRTWQDESRQWARYTIIRRAAM